MTHTHTYTHTDISSSIIVRWDLLGVSSVNVIMFANFLKTEAPTEPCLVFFAFLLAGFFSTGLSNMPTSRGVLPENGQ